MKTRIAVLLTILNLVIFTASAVATQLNNKATLTCFSDGTITFDYTPVLPDP